MNRAQILAQYRQRIQKGERIKLTAPERAVLVQDFVARLRFLNTPQAIQQLCQAEIALLEEGYGKGSNSTTNYLSHYRTAIAEAVQQGQLTLTHNTIVRVADPKQATDEPTEAVHHLAWALMQSDNGVERTSRRAAKRNNADRELPQFEPEQFLKQAAQLLQADQPESLAVGITAITGRDYSEIAASRHFCLAQHPYLLLFDGQPEQHEPVAARIVSLLPAQTVMQAIQRFRSLPQVQELQGASSPDQRVEPFRARVDAQVKLYFQQTALLPAPHGAESVSMPQLQAAYGRMVVYFWLPNQGANGQQFLKLYLGHLKADPRSPAPDSMNQYFGYRLVNGSGRSIRASGIKLMGNPHLPNPSPAQQELEQRLLHNQVNLPEDSFNPEKETMQPTSDAVEAIALQLEMLPNKQPKQMQLLVEPEEAERQPASLAPSAPPQKTYSESSATQRPEPQMATQPTAPPRLKQISVDVEHLSYAAHRLGLQLTRGKGRGYQSLLSQLLEQILAADLPDPSRPVAPAAATTGSTASATANPDLLATTLAALAQQVATLRQQVQAAQMGPEPPNRLTQDLTLLKDQLHQTQQERDALRQQVEQLRSAQQERDQLQGQLQIVQSRLDQFLVLAQDVGALPASSPASKPVTPSSTAPLARELSEESLDKSPDELPRELLEEFIDASSDKSVPDVSSPALLPALVPEVEQPSALPDLSLPDEPQPAEELPDQNSTPSSRQISQQSKPTVKRSADERIQIAIEALMQYNESCAEPKDRWFISGNVIADMSGTNPAVKVKPWLQERPDLFQALQRHNLKMGTTRPHHNRGRNKEQLKAIYAAFLG